MRFFITSLILSTAAALSLSLPAQAQTPCPPSQAAVQPCAVSGGVAMNSGGMALSAQPCRVTTPYGLPAGGAPTANCDKNQLPFPPAQNVRVFPLASGGFSGSSPRAGATYNASGPMTPVSGPLSLEGCLVRIHSQNVKNRMECLKLMDSLLSSPEQEEAHHSIIVLLVGYIKKYMPHSGRSVPLDVDMATDILARHHVLDRDGCFYMDEQNLAKVRELLNPTRVLCRAGEIPGARYYKTAQAPQAPQPLPPPEYKEPSRVVAPPPPPPSSSVPKPPLQPVATDGVPAPGSLAASATGVPTPLPPPVKVLPPEPAELDPLSRTKITAPPQPDNDKTWAAAEAEKARSSLTPEEELELLSDEDPEVQRLIARNRSLELQKKQEDDIIDVEISKADVDTTDWSCTQAMCTSRLKDSLDMTQILDIAEAVLSDTQARIGPRLSAICDIKCVSVADRELEPRAISTLSGYVERRVPFNIPLPGQLEPPIKAVRPDVQAALYALTAKDRSKNLPFEIQVKASDLRGADLSRANLFGVNLSFTNLSAADLSEAYGLIDWNKIYLVTIDETTKIPESVSAGFVVVKKAQVPPPEPGSFKVITDDWMFWRVIPVSSAAPASRSKSKLVSSKAQVLAEADMSDGPVAEETRVSSREETKAGDNLFENDAEISKSAGLMNYTFGSSSEAE